MKLICFALNMQQCPEHILIVCILLTARWLASHIFTCCLLLPNNRWVSESAWKEDGDSGDDEAEAEAEERKKENHDEVEVVEWLKVEDSLIVEIRAIE